ncbi:MAG TPA: hypothetical protein VGQ42_17405 [Candidatus Dormibacteraeota bacterium]|nr:hypothetical protein [Candidatus Dormibacteraeota bacterium]
MSPGQPEEEVFEGLFDELGRAFHVVPYTAATVCARGDNALGVRTLHHPADVIARMFPAVATSLHRAADSVPSGGRVVVASLPVTASAAAAAYMITSQGAVVFLAPISENSIAKRAAMLALSAEFIGRTEESCMRLMALLASSEALMIPEGSHDDRYRTLRLFCGRAAMSRLQGSLYKRWRPLQWIALAAQP